MPVYDYGSLVPSTSPCVDVDTVKSYFSCNGGELCCTDAVILAEIEVALEVIEKVTGQWWCPRTACIEFDHDIADGRLYFIPTIDKPLKSLTSIQDQNDNDITTQYLQYEYFIDFCQCPPTCDCLTVCGVWGKDMPATIQKALAILVWETLSPGSSGLVNDTGLTRVDWDDFSASYAVDTSSSDEYGGTGIRYVDNILYQYVNHAGMVTPIGPERKKKNCCDNLSCGRCG